MSEGTLKNSGELVFEVFQEADGGYVANCLTENIVTQGDTWAELRANIKDAVEGYFLTVPSRIP